MTYKSKNTEINLNGHNELWYGTNLENSRAIAKTGFITDTNGMGSITAHTDFKKALHQARGTTTLFSGTIAIVRVAYNTEGLGPSMDTAHMAKCMYEYNASQKPKYIPRHGSKTLIESGAAIYDEVTRYHVLTRIWDRTSNLNGMQPWEVIAKQFQPILNASLTLRTAVAVSSESHDLKGKVKASGLWLIKSYVDMPQNPDELNRIGHVIELNKASKPRKKTDNKPTKNPSSSHETSTTTTIRSVNDPKIKKSKKLIIIDAIAKLIHHVASNPKKFKKRGVAGFRKRKP